MKYYSNTALFLLSLIFITTIQADNLKDLLRFKKAYPEFILSVDENQLVWHDGTIMLGDDGKYNKTPEERLQAPSLLDQVSKIIYDVDIPKNPLQFNPTEDPGRIRYTPFFLKMYGESEEIVKSHCVIIYWMPIYFKNKYPLLVSTVNKVNQKLIKISNELEVLLLKHPDYLPFVDNPKGTLNWRTVAHTNRLSPHSFGMTIDINSKLSNYWQWDLEKKGRPIDENEPLTYKNDIPWKIVAIFEKNGFIWGGRWHHYDSMHFEYRPELLTK